MNACRPDAAPSFVVRPWIAAAALLLFVLPSPAAAQGHGDSVWVNTNSGTYHCPGSHSYGTSKHGEYMLEAAAVSHHFRPAKGRSCAARAARHPAVPTAAGAAAHGDSVWVNTDSHEYRCPGSSKYGQGHHGVFMTEQAALAAGNRSRNGRRCH